MARKPLPPPLSIRLPDDERAELKARATRAGLSVSGYFRVVAFNIPRRSRNPSASEQELAKINTALGKIGGNLNQLAKAANSGTLVYGGEIGAALAGLAQARDAILRALGREPHRTESSDSEAGLVSPKLRRSEGG